MKVLYVEDNDDDVYMLKTRLELLGDFEVVTARNGEKGCELAVGERPDIIIMDLEMPVMGRVGSRALAQERTANARHPDCGAVGACARRRTRKGVRGGM
jgi:CheY-like chemotaxis protein